MDHIEWIPLIRPKVRHAALLLSVLIWLGGAETAGAQADAWMSRGPYGGSISALAIDPGEPTTVYAGTEVLEALEHEHPSSPS